MKTLRNSRVSKYKAIFLVKNDLHSHMFTIDIGKK